MIPAAGTRMLAPEQVVCPDSPGRALLEIAARAVRRRPVHDLDRVPLLGRHGRLPDVLRADAVAAESWANALPAEAVEAVDPEAVAEWIIGHYPDAAYPAVVLGSPHGAAVHLAAALGAPWLPAGFAMTGRWAGGAVGDWPGAARYGAGIAARMTRAGGVTVSQVHDPIGRATQAATTVSLHVRWRRLPEAYRHFLRTRLARGADCLLVRDVRPWPVRRTSDRHTFQIGSPAHGLTHDRYTADDPVFGAVLAGMGAREWEPVRGFPGGFAETAVEPGFEVDLHRSAGAAGRRSHHVLYSDAQALSAAVADLYRTVLGGRRCVVECERLLDPWQVLSSGSVPYWCETASRTAALAAETWVAGSPEYDAITVRPQPPGTTFGGHADLAQWRSVSRFARVGGEVDRRAAHRYPALPLPVSSAARGTGDTAAAPPVPMDLMLAALRGAAPVSGLLFM